MADEEDIASRTKELIHDYVEAHWTRKPIRLLFLVLSELTYVIPLPKVEQYCPMVLANFCANIPIVRVIQYPGVAQKIAAIPLSVDVPEDLRDLFSQSKSATANANRNVYLQEFWDASSFQFTDPFVIY